MGLFKEFSSNKHNRKLETEMEGLSDIFNNMDENEESHIEMLLSGIKHQASLNESLSIVQGARNQVKDFLKRHEENYKSEIGQPIGRSQRKDRIHKVITENYEFEKNNPTEHRLDLEKRAARYGHTMFGVHNMKPEDVERRIGNDLGNSKTDTNINNDKVKRRMPDGKIKTVGANLGFTGNAGGYSHYHNSKMEESTDRVKCASMTKDCGVGHKIKDRNGKDTYVNPSCLNKSGGANFAATVAKYNREDHARNASGEFGEDHAIFNSRAIKRAAENHAKKGKIIDVRGQQGDQDKMGWAHQILNATTKSHPHLNSHIHEYDYNKNLHDALGALRRGKKALDQHEENKGTKSPDPANLSRAESANFSHAGPTYYQDSHGNRHLNDSNIEKHQELYDTMKKADEEKLDHHTYLVKGGRNTRKDEKTGEEVPFGNKDKGISAKQPKSNATPESRASFLRADSSHKKTRYHSTVGERFLEDHEPDTHHVDHGDGTGHGYTAVHQEDKDGNIRRVAVPYIEHLNNHLEGHGHVEYKDRTDGAAGGIGHSRSQSSHSVSSASDNAALGEHPNSLHHQTHDSTVLDRSSGILHVANPKVMSSLGHHYNVPGDEGNKNERKKFKSHGIDISSIMRGQEERKSVEQAAAADKQARKAAKSAKKDAKSA